MSTRKISKLLPLLLLTLILAPTHSLQSSGANRYVNNSDPTCLNQSPCYATIQKAVDAAQAGDIIRIQAGQYNEAIVVKGKNKASGATEADRIFIEADSTAPNGSVVIGTPDTSCTTATVFQFASSRFVTLRGVTIRNAGVEAIRLLGANHHNTDIHIDRTRIFGNGTCPGGIVIAKGNARTVLANNLIYGNGQNGVTFGAGQGGPHYVVGNTIHGNGKNGVSFDRAQEVWLVNNVITQNGQNGADPQGEASNGFGGKRTPVGPQPHPQRAVLLANLICGNLSGELSGAILDSTDMGNLTPTGQEGNGVSQSPGCDNMTNIYADLNGTDGLPNTDDDDFTLASASPAIDHGVDPQVLGLGTSFDALFAADFTAAAVRPHDGDDNGTAEFDMGALEKVEECKPGTTASCYSGPSGTQDVGLCRAGTKTCQADGTFGACKGQVLPSTEIPNNGLDENCDGHDAACTSGTSTECYDGPAGTKGVGICKAGTKTCSADGLFGACVGQVLPGVEIPGNGVDENCDGRDAVCAPGATTRRAMTGQPGPKASGNVKPGQRRAAPMGSLAPVRVRCCRKPIFPITVWTRTVMAMMPCACRALPCRVMTVRPAQKAWAFAKPEPRPAAPMGYLALVKEKSCRNRKFPIMVSTKTVMGETLNSRLR